ncbi:MAG: hypothetical protein J7639_33025 [Paenibacillaceae bacterium]|nr:hypothetical protein [Paenibacillaceae bacterium]
MNKAAKDDQWALAKNRCRLNEMEIRMAKELGMTPKGLIKNIPAKSQLWKEPVNEWVRSLYAKRFGDRLPAAAASQAGTKPAKQPSPPKQPLPVKPQSPPGSQGGAISKLPFAE